MHDELITPDNLSKELLHELFDAAFMETRLDAEGDLVVKWSGISCFVLPSPHRDRIKLLAFFRENGASVDAKMRLANRVNEEYVMLRAAVTKNERVAFDYDLLVTGGVTRKAVVLAVQRFLTIPTEAIAELDTEHVFA